MEEFSWRNFQLLQGQQIEEFMKIQFSWSYHLLHVSYVIKKLSGPQQKGDLLIIIIPSICCVSKALLPFMWIELPLTILFTDLELLFGGLLKKFLSLYKKFMFLALLKCPCIHNNHIYYTSALWKCLNKAQECCCVVSAAGECVNIFLDGTGKHYWASEPRGMINRHVSI